MACIQETHLNPNHIFSIRGYQTFRMDREGRHKGGVLILVKNDITSKDFKINTGQRSEIHGAHITMGNTTVTIFNFYCPSDKDLALHTMNLPRENCLTVGDLKATQLVGDMRRSIEGETKLKTGRLKLTYYY